MFPKFKRFAAVALMLALCTVSALATDPPAPDATDIADAANTAFGVVAPIVIAIASFFVIVRIAKRVVK